MNRLSLPDFKELLATPEPPELGPGPRNGVASEPELAKALDELLDGTQLPRDRAQLVRALIFLWHDHLDMAHRISQAIENQDGAFVHGIVHRREPDFGNAAYWFRRVGIHPAFSELATQAAALASVKANAPLRDKLISHGEWDAMGMIFACEQATRKGWMETLREVQQVETECLVNWLLRG